MGPYDAELIEQLREDLFPGAVGSIEELLKGSDLTAENLIRAFFVTLRPFAKMKEEILRMLQDAESATSGNSLSIRFNFDRKREPLDLLLEHFRRQMEVFEQGLTLDDGPGTERDYRSADRAKAALARAKQNTGSVREAEVRKGMGALRRTLEELVVAFLFKNVIPRWEDRVIVTALPRVSWDNTKVQRISDLYEELSRYIDAHTHTDIAMGAPPTPDQLEAFISEVDTLVSWAKKGRAPTGGS
jgi:hypothetical protein